MYLTDDLDRDIESLGQSGARVFTIGYSLLGRPIKCAVKGNLGGGQIFMQAAIHAREWATAQLAVKMLQEYDGDVGVWCVPMSNPDGAMLAQLGLDSVTDESLRNFLLQVNGGSYDFSLWKANARAVDLNVNFNAKWGTGAQNVDYPSPSDYVGMYPRSEPETRALCDFTEKIQPSLTLSYHAKGNVIYRGFECVNPYPQLAEQISASTGYPAYSSSGSSGGYKDWYVTTAYKPGLTVEVGESEWSYPQIQDNMDIVLAANRQVLDICARFVQDNM